VKSRSSDLGPKCKHDKYIYLVYCKECAEERENGRGKLFDDTWSGVDAQGKNEIEDAE